MHESVVLFPPAYFSANGHSKTKVGTFQMGETIACSWGLGCDRAQGALAEERL